MGDLKQLTPREFDAHVSDGSLRLSFIGMSNAGKSYRSSLLNKELGFAWYDIDEKIYKELGLPTLGAISSWLGYPYSPTYPEREKKYLELENLFTKRAALEQNEKNLVFDTTGSVVHLDQETRDALKENSLMVHLDVGEGSLERMLERFLQEPKPVAWCGHLTIEAGENEAAALRRCYPLLLRSRLRKYRELAHVNIPAKEMYDLNATDTLAVIRAHLI